MAQSKLDDRTGSDGVYDDGKPSWRYSSEDIEIKENLEGPSAGAGNLTKNHPDRKRLESDELEDAEEDGSTPETDKAAQGELSALGKRGFYNRNADKPGKGLLGGLKGLTKNPKKALVGVGVVATLITLFLVTFNLLSFEAIHVRENMLDCHKSNRLVCRALQNRQRRNFMRKMVRLRKDFVAGALDRTKLNSKLAKHNFRVEFEGRKPRSLVYDGNGISRSFDFDDPNVVKAFDDLRGTEAGRIIARDLDELFDIRASMFKGTAGRAWYRRFAIRLVDWTKRKPSVDADTIEKKFTDLKNAADAADAKNAEIDATLRKASADLVDDPSTQSVIDDGYTEINKYQDLVKKLDKYGDTDDVLGDTSGAADELEESGKLRRLLDSDLTPSTLAQIVGELRNSYPRFASRIDDVALKGVRFINASEVIRVGCRVKGTLNFIAGVKNVFVTLQLAKFTVRYLTAADHQKAGLIRSEGLNIVMAYLHVPNPVTGKSYNQAGGFQNVVMGNASASPSETNLARFSGARSHTGLFASINNHVNKVTNNPVMGPSSCKFINNGFVQLGGLAVGLAAGIFSGGSVTLGQVGFGLSLAVAEEVVFLIGEPLITRTLTNAVVTGLNGEQAGDALASGWGAFRGMNAGANGTLPATKAEVAELSLEADEEYRAYIAQQSVFDRYFNTSRADSMLSQFALSMPSLFNLNPGRLLSSGAGIFNGSFASGLGMFGNKAFAETDCSGDEQIRRYNIATDIFCHPEMAKIPNLDTDQTEIVLRANGQIDNYGQPVPGTKFAEYLAVCHSGRPAVLYNADVSKLGTNSVASKECVEQQQPYPGDTIGRNLRYTDWYGWLVDDENLSEHINEEYEDEVPVSQPTGTSAIIPIAGSVLDPCQAGTDAGIVDGYKAGQLYKIRICDVGGIKVNTQIAVQVDRLLKDAAAANIKFGGFGFRYMESQTSLYSRNCSRSGGCSPPTAKPGYSNHQMGLAIDFRYNGVTICYPNPASSCGGNPGFDWLVANAYKYGLKNFPKEAWHWSVSGG